MPAIRKRKADQTVTKSQLGPMVRKINTQLYEKKAFTWVPFANAATVSTWTVKSLLGSTGAGNRIGQGTDYNQRVGDKIRLSRIHVSLRIQPQSVMPDANGNFCRVIVYHNKQANGAAPTATQIFNTDDVLSLRNHLLRERITILKDFVHQMVVTGTNAGANLTAGPEYFGTFTIYPKQIISYNGSTGEITEILKHDYGMAFATDTAACCVVNVQAQVVFTDA